MQSPIVAAAVGSKADWRLVARLVPARTRPGDIVITSNGWAKICLDYYLPRERTGLTFVSANESSDHAKALAASPPLRASRAGARQRAPRRAAQFFGGAWADG